MSRRLGIRTRTALTFGVVSVLLTMAVLAFVNLMSIRGIGSGLTQVELVPVDDLVDPESGDAGVVRLVRDQQWLWSAIGIGAAGLIATVAGWVVSWRALRPIDDITAAANRISATTLHERIDLGGPDDELRRLADTIDDLFARLEVAFDSQRRFVAHASHELRTPLAVQRASLQIGLPDDSTPGEIAAVREHLLDANRRTEHLIESLLALAEADRGLDRATSRFRFDELAEGILAGLSEASAASDVRVRVGPWTGLPAVQGDPVLGRQLLLNLVDNALEYNVRGGLVLVHGGADELVVENTGEVLDSDVAVRLAEPFRRTGAAGLGAGRRHSGLGLSIVDAIVRAHGWRLAIAARPGGGLVVRVRFGAPDRTAVADVSSM